MNDMSRLGKSQSSSSKSSLSSLPVEIQVKILRYLFPAWSIAMFDTTGLSYRVETLDLISNYNINNSIELKKVGLMALSGPPGSNIVQTCRHFHHLTQNIQAQQFTRNIYICHSKDVPGTMKALPQAMKRWIDKSEQLYWLYPRRLYSRNREYFQAMPYIHTFNFILMDRERDQFLKEINSTNWLRSNFHRAALEETADVTDWFFHRSELRRRLLGGPSHPRRTLNITFLAYSSTDALSDVGLKSTYTRPYSTPKYTDSFKITTRALRQDGLLRYWSDGMGEDQHADLEFKDGNSLPEEWRWLKTPGWFERYVMEYIVPREPSLRKPPRPDMNLPRSSSSAV